MTHMRKVIFIGGGGHARVLHDVLSSMPDYDILGYADVMPNAQMPVDYLGTDDQLMKTFKANDIILVNGIGSVQLPTLRQTVYERYKKAGYTFLTVIHPQASVSKRAQISEGVQIMAGAVVNTGAHIHENVIINTLSGIDHDCTIGAHTHVAPGAILCGEVTVGSTCHVGSGVNIIQGITVGSLTLIGAGALVIKHISSNQVCVGIVGKKTR